MAAEDSAGPDTVRDWLETTVGQFDESGLYFGHGSSNAHDEAVYLILHTLGLPLDELDPVLDRRLTSGELQSLGGSAVLQFDHRVLPANGIG